MTTSTLRQRADYTHRYNITAPRHGWLRLTPAYSVRIVQELLTDRPRVRRVFDPFCGTGTTALSAVQLGFDALTMDINPFLVWLARVKTAKYSPDSVAFARASASEAARIAGNAGPAPPAPKIHNISRWWRADDIAFLSRLKARITAIASRDAAAADLLRVAFCRTLIRLSNAAFNHQSMSFRETASPGLFLHDPGPIYLSDVEQVLNGADRNPSGTAVVLEHDARLAAPNTEEPVDCIVTSPPYANRMSYVREMRPYMYWLDYLHAPRDAGELDWRAIGGTWGIATSRLNGWRPGSPPNREVGEVVAKIQGAGESNAALLANYVAKYFEDLGAHVHSLERILSRGATVHYIIGNSVFYGVVVSTERILARMLEEAGFSDTEVRPIRKRNSKRELVEFLVSASWKQGPIV